MLGRGENGASAAVVELFWPWYGNALSIPTVEVPPSPLHGGAFAAASEIRIFGFITGHAKISDEQLGCCGDLPLHIGLNANFRQLVHPKACAPSA